MPFDQRQTGDFYWLFTNLPKIKLSFYDEENAKMILFVSVPCLLSVKGCRSAVITNKRLEQWWDPESEKNHKTVPI
jgi:hypothetical protein